MRSSNPFLEGDRAGSCSRCPSPRARVFRAPFRGGAVTRFRSAAGSLQDWSANAASAVTEAISYSSNCLGVISRQLPAVWLAALTWATCWIGENYTYTDRRRDRVWLRARSGSGRPKATTVRRMALQDALSMLAALSRRCVSRLRVMWEVRRGQMLAGTPLQPPTT